MLDLDLGDLFEQFFLGVCAERLGFVGDPVGPGVPAVVVGLFLDGDEGDVHLSVLSVFGLQAREVGAFPVFEGALTSFGGAALSFLGGATFGFGFGLEFRTIGGHDRAPAVVPSDLVFVRKIERRRDLGGRDRVVRLVGAVVGIGVGGVAPTTDGQRDGVVAIVVGPLEAAFVFVVVVVDSRQFLGEVLDARVQRVRVLELGSDLLHDVGSLRGAEPFGTSDTQTISASRPVKRYFCLTGPAYSLQREDRMKASSK